MRNRRCAIITPKGVLGLDGEPSKGLYEKGGVTMRHRMICSLMVIEQVLETSTMNSLTKEHN